MPSYCPFFSLNNPLFASKNGQSETKIPALKLVTYFFAVPKANRPSDRREESHGTLVLGLRFLPIVRKDIFGIRRGDCVKRSKMTLFEKFQKILFGKPANIGVVSKAKFLKNSTEATK